MSLKKISSPKRLVRMLAVKSHPLPQPIRVQPSKELLKKKDVKEYLSSITVDEIRKWNKPKVIVDVKYCGVRGLLLIDLPSKKIEVLSRNLKPNVYDKFIEKNREKILNGINFDKVTGDIVLDGEIFAYGKNKRVLDYGSVYSYLMTGKKGYTPKYEVFDILMLNNIDVRSLPLKERKKILKDVIKEDGVMEIAESKYLSLNEIPSFFKKVISKGHEGIIIKDPDQPYISGKGGALRWVKLKKADTLDLELKRVEAYPSNKPFKFYKHWVLCPYDNSDVEVKADKPIKSAMMKYDWYVEFTKNILENLDKFKTSDEKVFVDEDFKKFYGVEKVPKHVEFPKNKRLIVELFSEYWTKNLKGSGVKIVGIRKDKDKADTLEDLKSVSYINR